MTVPAGTTITWRNTGGSPHTATAADGSFDTGRVEAGAEASITVTEPGEYLYYCEFHRAADGEGMVATLIVE